MGTIIRNWFSQSSFLSFGKTKADASYAGRKELIVLLGLTLLVLTGLIVFPVGPKFWDWTDGLSLVLLLTIGLVHGAYDLYLDLKGALPELARFKVRTRWYLSVLSFFAMLFLAFQGLGIIAFILVSAYHFGQQLLSKIEGYANPMTLHTFWCSYGLSILLGLFLIHFSEVDRILGEWFGFGLQVTFLHYVFGLVMIVQAVTLGLVIRKTALGPWDWLLLQFSIIVLLALFSYVSLLTGFGFFFIFWHSIPSIRQQIIHNYGSFHGRGLIGFLKKALPFWAVFLAISLIVVVLFPKTALVAYGIPLVMAAVMPHVFLMDKIFQGH